MSKRVLILGKDPLGKAKYANVTESGDLRVQLSGQIPPIFVATVDDVPDADTVGVGQIVMVVQTQELLQSDGSEWVVMGGV